MNFANSKGKNATMKCMICRIVPKDIKLTATVAWWWRLMPLHAPFD
jgi:hypothetical protein